MRNNKKKVKKIRKYTRRTTKLAQFKWEKMLLRTVRTTMILGGVIVLLYLYHISIGAQKFHIQKVTFDEVTLQTLEYLPLYTHVSTQLKGRNYLLTKRRGMTKLLSSIQAEDPLVSSIQLSLAADQTVLVKLQFNTPIIVFQTPDRRYVSFREHVYPVANSSPLAYTILPVQLPSFTSGRQDINGVFWQIKESQLKAAVDLILSTLGSASVQELIYHP